MSADGARIAVDVPGDWLGLPVGSRAVLAMPVAELSAGTWSGSVDVSRAVRVCVPEDAAWGSALHVWSGGLSIRVLTETQDARLATLRPRWECASAEIPPGRSALARLREYGEAGVPARLVDLDAWPGSDLAAALDFYLTWPTLETPVEPWHSLALAVSGGSPCDLWQADGALVGSSIYISAEGLATLSARFARHGQWFGECVEGLESWRVSALWRELAGHRRKLFLARARCAFCPAFLWCGGFWVAPGAEDHERCEVWQSLVARLAAMAREVVPPGPGGTHPVGT